jgi:hypothetical protein
MRSSFQRSVNNLCGRPPAAASCRPALPCLPLVPFVGLRQSIVVASVARRSLAVSFPRGLPDAQEQVCLNSSRPCPCLSYVMYAVDK